MEGTDLTSPAPPFQSWLRRNIRWVTPLALAILYFAYGFARLSEYGVTWDEPLHRNWGKLFYLFWKTGDRTALTLMPGHGVDYGPLYYTVNYLFSEWLYGHGWLRFVESNHVLNLFTASVAVGLAFTLGRMIGGFRSGLIAAAFFILYPALLAHAQYNPKDIPLMTAVLITAVAFVTGLKRGSRAFFVLSAFFMGASVAVKVSALLMAPVFGVTYLAWIFLDPRAAAERSFGRQTVLIALCLAALAAGTFLFWPDAWGDPLLIPRAIRFFAATDFWPGQVLFFGKNTAGAELPWYYTSFEFFAVTPLLTLLAFTLGIAVIIRHFRSRSDKSERILLLSWVFFPLLFSMKPGLVRYDGIRQFFFVLPAASVIAAIGLHAGLAMLGQRFRASWIIPAVSALILLDLCFEIGVAHPFEGSYRNEALRLAYPSGMDRVFQIEYWGPTYKQGMDWLIANAEPHPVICVPTAGVLIDWYPWREDFTFECSKKTDYVMFFTRYSETGKFATLQNTQAVFTIDRMGARLLDIYKIL